MEHNMQEINLMDTKLVNVLLRSSLSHQAASNRTYLNAEDILNTALLLPYHELPLQVPVIVLFEECSRSDSGRLQICIQRRIVLYSYKKNSRALFALGLVPTLNATEWLPKPC